jgi:hypothetical protein
MLQYVMIDPGAPLPHVTAAPEVSQPTLGYFGYLGEDDETAPTTMSSGELFEKLYQQNKLAFWAGGGVVGFLALAGLYSLIGGR